MKYLTSKEIREKFSIKSPATLWRWQQDNQRIFEKPFPPPIKFSIGSKSLWDEEQINTWELKYFRNNKSLVN